MGGYGITRRRSGVRQTDESGGPPGDARSHPEASNLSLLDIIVGGEGPKGETLGTRTVRIDLASSNGGQVIGRSFVHVKHVIAVNAVSSGHARLGVYSDELTTKDLDRCSGSPLDGENPESGHLRLIKVGACIGRRDIELDTHPPNVRY